MKGQLFLALMLTTLSMAPTLAKAGAGSSGGGNALVCFDTSEIPKQIRERDQAGNIIDGSIRNEHIKHITKVEVLDLVEAQFARGMSQPKLTDLIQPNSGEDVEEYAKRVIGRFKDVAPLLYDNLMARVDEMPAANAVAQPDGLYPVDDYNLLGRIDSTNCVVATVAIHQFSGLNLSGSPDLYFDQRLMFHSKHSDISRAITYLHEVVYSYARSGQGHKDSQDTRKLIGVMLRKNLTVTELSKAIQESLFNNSSYNFTEFKYGNRADRLGYWYTNLNFTLSYRAYFMMNISNDKTRLAFNKKFNNKMISDLSPLLESSACSSRSDDYYLLCLRDEVETISNSSAGFSKAKKEKIKTAKALVEKYSNYDEKRKKFTDEEVTPVLQKALKDLYRDSLKEELLSITNVDQDKLKEIDSKVESMIENNMELIKSRATEQSQEIFLEIAPLMKKIPLQTKI